VRGLASVTVVASHCLVAGTLTTMAMLKGERGAAWLEASGAHCLWVREDGRAGGSLAATGRTDPGAAAGAAAAS
jgi:thiamine biosynthesis lipoprotein